jgi:PIN domain nuclease of toxin-antitoxin system
MMMIAGVADTHAAIWYLFGDSHLSRAAKVFMDDAANATRKVVLSVISMAEIVYLIEKNRLPASAYDDLKTALADPEHVLEAMPLTVDIVEAMRQVPRDAVPDMPDRIVAATAVYLGVPVISRDGRICASSVQTVW